MSNLLEQASLVMIPSGYKEDIVYSEIPIDGSGDLQFTRSSNGTRVNSAGLVEVVPWNLCTYSEEFDTASWFKSSTTVTANAGVAPNGTTTADKIVPTTTGTNRWVEQSRAIIISSFYTNSAYIKADGFSWAILHHIDGSIGAWFNVSNGTVGTVNAGCTATIESVGNGWYRCSVAKISGGATGYTVVQLADADNSSTATTSGANGLLIWGAQANIGSTAKPYFPTTDRLNVPRLTYQNGGGGCPSLLLEKQSTNELSYSEEFDNAAWSVKDNLSVTANATTSPDGTQNADKLVEDSSNSIHRVYRSIDGTSKMFSFFAKPSGRSWVSVLCNNGNTWFDIGNGQLGTVASTSTATIENVGNGWYRCAVYNTHGTFGALIALATGNNGTSYQGDGTSGAFVWGAQLEASSYPTSYIPTTSSSATRVADACFKTGISSLIGQTEGVFFVDYNYDAKPDVNGNLPMVIYDGSNEAYIFITGGGSVRLELYNGGVLQCLLTTSIGAVGRKKIAFGYKQNDFVGYMNGVQIATDTSGTVGAMSNLYVGSYYTANYNANGGINQAILFKTRLSNSDLIALTTI